jgi:hypothetical protein
MLGVLAALLWWQSRFAWVFGNPMYGWPMPFNNVWYGNFYDAWLPAVLIFDAGIWLILAVSTAYVIDVWRRKPNKRQVTLRGLFTLQTIAAVMLALGCIEAYLRVHHDSGSIVPRYAQLRVGGVSLCFDIGLFTDPPPSWPVLRLTVLFAVACSVYAVGRVLCAPLFLVRRWKGRGTSQGPNTAAVQYAAASTSCPPNEQREPALARIAIYMLMTVVLVLALFTLFPPVVRT